MEEIERMKYGYLKLCNEQNISTDVQRTDTVSIRKQIKMTKMRGYDTKCHTHFDKHTF